MSHKNFRALLKCHFYVHPVYCIGPSMTIMVCEPHSSDQPILNRRPQTPDHVIAVGLFKFCIKIL